MQGIALDGVSMDPVPAYQPPHPAIVAAAGVVTSKTNWGATALLVLSNISPLLPEWCKSAGLDPHTIQMVGSAASVLIFALRTITGETLMEKGARVFNKE
jgi:hypothetical protein